MGVDGGGQRRRQVLELVALLPRDEREVDLMYRRDCPRPLAVPVAEIRRERDGYWLDLLDVEHRVALSLPELGRQRDGTVGHG